ncbi:SUKH-3 domain-containing protein [Paucibacter sp. DJ2R-2]|uniref:SUKH-3 domain-containing protein n=1 Tax=Paucibacter sp. DJ2R-2 TaxID=2893558 RepID=UPI0021E3B2FA|nr:SUKH-3 domain-containing protein [Paucibacter sp. DJ2R-2]MCV2423682.1 SUKH-3 domain-containing protein [Paucibacter sp. DJ4R-1]MCV2441517.1 SUKH-3 domain-containing protein [Paucibacter sp. DJ2R-2]
MNITESMVDLPEAIQPIFEAAGWTASEAIAVQAGIPTTAKSRVDAILRQYAGLQVGSCGPGTEAAASNVYFYRSHRADVAELLSPWRFQIGSCAAFANAHNDHMILFVSDDGSYFAFTDADECLYRLVGCFGDIMKTLIFGYQIGASMPRDVQPFAAADGFADR